MHVTKIHQDPFLAGDRESLPRLLGWLKEMAKENREAAEQAAQWVADPGEIAIFVNTLFRHATEGFVQLRCFVEGSHTPWGRHREGETKLWPTAHASDRDALIQAARLQASKAACVPDRVNFCPPPVTFKGRHTAREIDICEGVAIMVELDSDPEQAEARLTGVSASRPWSRPAAASGKTATPNTRSGTSIGGCTSRPAPKPSTRS